MPILLVPCMLSASGGIFIHGDFQLEMKPRLDARFHLVYIGY